MQIMFVVILAIGILLVAVVGMAFKVLLFKGKFPEGHAHDIAKLNTRNDSTKTEINH